MKVWVNLLDDLLFMKTLSLHQDVYFQDALLLAIVLLLLQGTQYNLRPILPE